MSAITVIRGAIVAVVVHNDCHLFGLAHGLELTKHDGHWSSVTVELSRLLIYHLVLIHSNEEGGDCKIAIESKIFYQ